MEGSCAAEEFRIRRGMRQEKRMYNLSWLLFLCLIAAGCTTTPQYNEPLTHYDPAYGYRFENLNAGDNSDCASQIIIRTDIIEVSTLDV